jgi:hypothetical protein
LKLRIIPPSRGCKIEVRLGGKNCTSTLLMRFFVSWSMIWTGALSRNNKIFFNYCAWFFGFLN